MNENMSTYDSTKEQRLREKDKKRDRILAIAIIVLVIGVLGFASFLLYNSLNKEIPLGGDFYDQSAAQIQEAVDQTVEDGYFNMTINSKIPVYEGSTALAGIQNVEANHFDCKVTITLENGTQIYQSGGLQPGQALETITLDQPLENGTYTATALFTIYDQNAQHTKAGETAAKVTLYVQ